MANIKRRTTDLVVEIHPHELAVLIGEAMMGIPRPSGISATELLRQSDPVMAQGFVKAAEVAIRYVVERINVGKQPS